MLRAQVLFLTIAGALTLQGADDTMPATHVNSGGASIEVTFAPGKVNLPQSTVLAWIKSAADSVSAYYGRFPVPHARILVSPVQGRRGIFNGTTWGMRGGFTRISIGQLTEQHELDNDWM